MQLDKILLRLLRNAFYASKGYVFKDKNLTDFFIQSKKYKPNEFIKENTIEFSQEEKDVLKIIIELENVSIVVIFSNSTLKIQVFLG